MRKFTKQISSLLAVVAAGAVTGGAVNAINSPDELVPLTGDVAVPTSECSAEAGVAIENPETRTTPTAGEVVIAPPEETTATPVTTVTLVGTEVSSRKTEKTISESFSEKYSETEITPTAGVPMVSRPEESVTTTGTTPAFPIGTETSSRKTEATTSESFTEKYSETEMPPNAGEPLYSRPEESVTTTVTTPAFPIGTETRSSKTEVTTTKSVRGSGDIDANGKTESTDLTHLSLYLLHDETFSEEQLTAADLTKDGDVNLADLAHLKMVIMHDDIVEKK